MENPRDSSQALPASRAAPRQSRAEVEHLVKKASSVSDAASRERLLRDALDKIVGDLIQSRTSRWQANGVVLEEQSEHFEEIANDIVPTETGQDYSSLEYGVDEGSAEVIVDSGIADKVDVVTISPIGKPDENVPQIKQETRSKTASSSNKLHGTNGNEPARKWRRQIPQDVPILSNPTNNVKAPNPLPKESGSPALLAKKQTPKERLPPVNIDAINVINVVSSPLSPRTPISRDTSRRSITSDSQTTLSTRSSGHHRTFSTSTEQSIRSHGSSGSPRAGKKPRKLEVRSPPKKSPRKLEVRGGSAKSSATKKSP